MYNCNIFYYQVNIITEALSALALLYLLKHKLRRPPYVNTANLVELLS